MGICFRLMGMYILRMMAFRGTKTTIDPSVKLKRLKIVVNQNPFDTKR